MIFEVRPAFLGRLARFRVDPVGDADFRFRFLQRFGRLERLAVRVLHVLHGFDERVERPILAHRALRTPVETIGTLDDARAIVVRRCLRKVARHDASVVMRCGAALDLHQDIAIRPRQSAHMPWNESYYPASMKNLPEDVREKAIEIANALLRAGRPEGQAIRIGIAKAEESAAGAPQDEVGRAGRR